jgi:adenosylcobinamide-GDP ribazoletransferase
MTDFAARLRQLPADTVTALSFFSRLPVKVPAGPFDLRRSSAAWPLAGLVLAAGPALLLWLCGFAGMPNLLAALIALGLLAALTGGLHEDGLADVADGFGGGSSREKKLAIMRDSRIGTYGVLALLFCLLIKIAALAALGLRPGHGALALAGAAIVSRALALWHWNATMPARSDGLAWAAGRPDWLSLAIGGATGLVAAVLLLFVFGPAALIGCLLALIATSLFSSLCVRQIGGHSGDTIGASQQIAETFLLIGLASAWDPVIWAPILA